MREDPSRCADGKGPFGPQPVASVDKTLFSTVGRVLTGRWFFKVLFLAYFVFAVIRLLQFERWARGAGPMVPRPEIVGGILPIGHFTSFFAWVRGGGWDTILPAGLVIIIGSVVVSFVFKRGFCGWVCPVGTVWELCAEAGRRVLGRNVRVWRWLDLAGRGLRYLFAAFFVFVLFQVPLHEAVAFRELPYMWVADLKIIHRMAEPAWLVAALLAAVASFVFGPVWCRYLCPLGGLYSAAGCLSPCALRRDPQRCIHCSRCNEVCHAFVAPERMVRVWAPECDGCMECVRECPIDGCLEGEAVSLGRIRPWAWPLLAVGLWMLIWAGAVALGQWRSGLPPEAFRTAIRSGILEQETRGFFE